MSGVSGIQSGENTWIEPIELKYLKYLNTWIGVPEIPKFLESGNFGKKSKNWNFERENYLFKICLNRSDQKMCSKCSECCQGSRHSVDTSPTPGSDSEPSGGYQKLDEENLIIHLPPRIFYHNLIFITPGKKFLNVHCKYCNVNNNVNSVD